MYGSLNLDSIRSLIQTQERQPDKKLEFELLDSLEKYVGSIDDADLWAKLDPEWLDLKPDAMIYSSSKIQPAQDEIPETIWYKFEFKIESRQLGMFNSWQTDDLNSTQTILQVFQESERIGEELRLVREYWNFKKLENHQAEKAKIFQERVPFFRKRNQKKKLVERVKSITTISHERHPEIPDKAANSTYLSPQAYPEFEHIHSESPLRQMPHDIMAIEQLFPSSYSSIDQQLFEREEAPTTDCTADNASSPFLELTPVKSRRRKSSHGDQNCLFMPRRRSPVRLRSKLRENRVQAAEKDENTTVKESPERLFSILEELFQIEAQGDRDQTEPLEFELPPDIL